MNSLKEKNQLLADNIKKIRQEHHLTQEDFAQKLGVTRQAVSRWEMGISAPSAETLIHMCHEFQVSPETVAADPLPQKAMKKADLAKIAGLEFLIVGLLGLISLPCLAEWLKFKNMELYKTTYEYSWHYIFEYPLSVLLIASVLMAGTGIFILYRQRRKMQKSRYLC